MMNILNIQDANKLEITNLVKNMIPFTYDGIEYLLAEDYDETNTYSELGLYKYENNNYILITSINTESKKFAFQETFIKNVKSKDFKGKIIDKEYFIKQLSYYELCTSYYSPKLRELKRHITYQENMIKNLQDQIKIRKLEIMTLQTELRDL